MIIIVKQFKNRKKSVRFLSPRNSFELNLHHVPGTIFQMSSHTIVGCTYVQVLKSYFWSCFWSSRVKKSFCVFCVLSSSPTLKKNTKWFFFSFLWPNLTSSFLIKSSQLHAPWSLNPLVFHNRCLFCGLYHIYMDFWYISVKKILQKNTTFWFFSLSFAMHRMVFIAWECSPSKMRAFVGSDF